MMCLNGLLVCATGHCRCSACFRALSVHCCLSLCQVYQPHFQCCVSVLCCAFKRIHSSSICWSLIINLALLRQAEHMRLLNMLHHAGCRRVCHAVAAAMRQVLQDWQLMVSQLEHQLHINQLTLQVRLPPRSTALASLRLCA